MDSCDYLVLVDVLQFSYQAAKMSSSTGYVWHELYAWHDSGLESYLHAHPYRFQPRGSNESAESKRRMHNLIVASGLCDKLAQVRVRQATDDEITSIHTPEWLKRVKDVSAQPAGGQVGHELHISHGGFEIAALSAGGVVEAVRKVARGELKNAYALVRPPGHHADRDHGHGFCCFSNVSIAAQTALSHPEQYGNVRRIAVVDIDVHHGNGTESQFYDRSDLLFISLHQDKLYPLTTGEVTAVGEGAGRGFSLNIPLPPGCGQGAYDYAFDTVVEPALLAFQPDLIIVSCGFDASFLDTLGRMMLTSESFRLLTRRLMKVAERVCNGKLVYAHEGGYSEVYVPYCGLAVLEELSGISTGVVDPFIADVGSPAHQPCLPHQAQAVDKAKENLAIALLASKA